MPGKETDKKKNFQSDQDPSLNTGSYTAGGEAKIRPEEHFTLDASAFGLDWVSKTLVRPWVMGDPSTDTVTTWGEHLKKAFKTLASKAVREDKENKIILIGGHSQLVFYMAQIASWKEILQSKKGKIANGAILRFKVDADTGAIVEENPLLDFPDRPNRKTDATCFENKEKNTKDVYCSICTSAPCSTGEQKTNDMEFVSAQQAPTVSTIFPLCAVVFGLICTAIVFLFKQNHTKGDEYVAFLNEEVDEI